MPKFRKFLVDPINMNQSSRLEFEMFKVKNSRKCNKGLTALFFKAMAIPELAITVTELARRIVKSYG